MSKLDPLLLLYIITLLSALEVHGISDASGAGPNYQHLSVAQVIRSSGFEAHTYDVTSKDGYITTATRIINPEANQSSITRTVILHHGILQTVISPQLSLCAYTRPKNPFNSDSIGLMTNAGDFTINEKNDNKNQPCLPYYMSNNNYDVWLLEARGSTIESSRHIDPEMCGKSESYWDFDTHDQAVYDLPAQIDKVREISGRDRVAYIGFSLSNSFMYILLSEQPEFSEKLTAFISIAPVAFYHRSRGLYRALFEVLNTLPSFVTNNLNKPFIGPMQVTQSLNGLVATLCKLPPIATTTCRTAFNLIAGPDAMLNILDQSFFSRAMAPTSFKNFIQLGQWAQKSTFNRFDYRNAQENIRHYGQPTAPNYNVSRINFDKMIFVRSTGNDYLSNKEDQKELINHLSVPLFRDIIVPPHFDHFGYFLADTSFYEVTLPVIRALEDAYNEAKLFNLSGEIDRILL